ncbi:DUF2797 domain-containing protein [Streptomyces sp. NPDC001793]|uniref:DUF2797 domain-containing protein n=1 Tax=Streptomyces sp. NPDC001793 TaxID=3154657 RepID=UPI0033283BB0
MGQRLGWYCAERGAERASLLPPGKELAFAAVGERRCLGVRRAGRWIVCPYEAVLESEGVKDQCPRCAQLDRSRSVAADTMADDPRPYGVYLAYFGPGLVKVGITAVERGAARLVEQGAVAYAWLGRGPLMAARRAEALLGSALGVPDRFGKEAKRAARGVLPPVAERVAELAEMHGRAQGLGGWPETLEPVAFSCADHTELFGLERIAAAGGAAGGVAELGGMTAGAEIVGEVVAGAGADVYLRLVGAGERGGGGSGGGAVVAVMDGRLLAGWVLGAARGRVTTVPVRWGGAGRAEEGGEQGGLF